MTESADKLIGSSTPDTWQITHPPGRTKERAGGKSEIHISDAELTERVSEAGDERYLDELLFYLLVAFGQREGVGD